MHRHLHTSLFIRHLLDSPVQFYLIINFIHVHCHTNYTPPSPKTLSLTLKLIKTWGFYCEAAIARQITATDIKALYYIVQQYMVLPPQSSVLATSLSRTLNTSRLAKLLDTPAVFRPVAWSLQLGAAAVHYLVQSQTPLLGSNKQQFSASKRQA